MERHDTFGNKINWWETLARFNSERGYFHTVPNSPQLRCVEFYQSVICIEAAAQIPYSIPPFSSQMG